MNTKILERDPIAPYLPDMAEWDLVLADVAYDYVRDAIKRGVRVAAGEISITPSVFVDNPKVTEWLRQYTIRLAGNVNCTTIDAVRDTLAEGIDAGEAVRDLSKRVGEVMGDAANKYRANLIAQTETSRAETAGRLEQMKEAGAVRKVWRANQDACEYCMAIDGMVIEIEKPFFAMGDSVSIERPGGTDEQPNIGTMHLDYSDTNGPPLHPACVLADTRCEAPGGIITGLRAFYEGPVIELCFETGASLTVTPNHMLLGTDGFVTAESIAEGTQIFYCPGIERIITSNPDANQAPARIEDIFSSLLKTSGMATRQVPVSPEYLHGDGRNCDGYIDIVAPDCLLGRAVDTLRVEQSHDLNFGRADIGLIPFTTESDLATVFFALANAARGIVRSNSETLAVGSRNASHSGKHSFTAVPGSDSAQPQPSANDRTGNGQILCELIDRHAGLVALQPVTTVRRFDFAGHVYDLQTPSSLYIGNGIISSNCRCIVEVEFD